ncbi:hypothetical protein MPK71_gp073 [Erwinia phage pEa_SNUABM_1]|uniref:Uncharacterized protein n=1 Tax=Erwinia phage pEa_SNUABM_1 TaxID=2869543 RepID=A0AAE8BZQ7_9CAUD|nr:hypothetical protein MPK71_gp073 [Erwinia phage pEa_SNUABM_1]QZE57282.1 hypothetical protein pEaSNUABM1_00073 [Erwinia phage pEa_SNUABM_1]
MASPLAEINIGSPLPDSGDLIFKQILDGSIEILDSTLDLHKQSSVLLRSTKELGIDILNGTWTYTPQYTYENRHPLAYTFGHMMADPKSTYQDLAKELTTKAEQDMFYAPLRKLRAFMINHDTVTGKTDLRMPDAWVVKIDETLTMRDFMGVVEGYVQSEQRQEISAVVFEKYYATGESTKEAKARLVFRDDKLHIVDYDRFIPGVNMMFPMTSIFKFISRPWDHGMTQSVFKLYRSLVNL